ncbi:arginine utilization protein RocB [Lysinibacillus composti]|uniref:M20/M25/M40 family metallo-hydrolase n=1 Tax=Lysinibacillus composti TaxID=720633 RepID=A0A3N9UQ09_9BACI|nr:M20/M25/M40 family metallo-hydrolase [Lysinibacillus composti]MBM7609465.1 arginine utilization protein RocB [Lysinibacillus composti]RQW73996.1 M20/M25/M40 family metallo-hydrolase [Lysinibacillus composti]
MLNCREDILAYTKELVNIESIVNTTGETTIAQSLFKTISSLQYFSSNPESVVLEKTTDDDQERYNVMAFVKGKKGKSNRTIILMGHIDTVGIDDFNQLKEHACFPDDLMEALKNEELPTSAKEHLESGDWLFGRGVLDMKSGVASNLYLLKYYSEHPEELDGNIVLLAECDEEDGSHGVLSALKVLKKWKKEHGFEYIAAINSDFVSPRFEGDENRYIYKGTVGKLLPSFFITGAETHVGSAFEGLDPNFIAAELTKQINYNTELSNEAYGETTVPPVSLKQTDLKPSYTVQTALSAYVYYNFFIHSWSPKDVLAKLKEQAMIAFNNALTTFEERYRNYSEISGEPFVSIPWKPRVFTYEEMEHLLCEENGDEFIVHMNEFKQSLLKKSELDTRMFAARVVEEAWKWMKDKSPAIILFYSSLYSPRIELTGKTDDELKLINALDQAVETIQPEYPHPIVTRNFFPYISDMSFMALSDDEDGINAVSKNNPGWGTKHYVEFQDIRDINVPVVNIGPYGLDAHKKLERMEMKYSLEIVPNITNQVIQNLLSKE